MADSGIYEIVNLRNGKRYIGSTRDFKRRWQDHRSYLLRGAHHCAALQRAWSKYGEDAFAYRVLEECCHTELVEREQSAIDRLRPEYNSCPLAHSSRLLKHTAEARANMSAAQRRRFCCPLVRAAHLAMVRRPENRAKSSAANRGNTHFSGRRHTDEARAKISDAMTGIRHSQVDLASYTLVDAAGAMVHGIRLNLRRKTGLSEPEISMLLKGKRKSARGWRLASQP